jgi:hypothetical protein
VVELAGPADGRGVRRLQPGTPPAPCCLGATSHRAFKGFWPPLAEDPDAKPVHREFARLDNAIDKVVVSDSLTEDETGPWRSTTRIVHRADAHTTIAELKLLRYEVTGR